MVPPGAVEWRGARRLMKEEKMKRLLRATTVLAALAGAALLAGCATQQSQPYPPQRYAGEPAQVYQTQADPYGTRYGTVVGIEGERGSGGTSGAGAVAGGVIGGVIGNQVGRGTGRALATIAGVVGGAVAGNAIESHANRSSRGPYAVTIRFDDGAQQVFSVPELGGMRRGERVRFYRGQITRLQ